MKSFYSVYIYVLFKNIYKLTTTQHVGEKCIKAYSNIVIDIDISYTPMMTSKFYI